MFPSALSGSITHFKMGNISLKLVPGLLLGSCIGSYFGSSIAKMTPEKQLKILFSIVLAISGLKMIF